MMGISHHHLATGTRNSLRVLIAFALTLLALLAAAIYTQSGIAAWEPHFVFNRALSPMPLGNYANTVVQLGANTTVAPDAAPANTSSINVSTSTNFKGKLEGDPATGVVRVTNAHPAGTYTVTITGFDGGPATKTFTLGVTTPPTCSPVTFATAANFNVVSPVSVAVGDFNGDGDQDLATANANTNDITVLYGNGAGGFLVGTSVSAGSNPRSIAVVDFNGDGKPDLVTANRSSNNVTILLGNANGGFNPATNFDVGSGPIAVAVGDFNADRKQDLAVANFGSVSVSILLGDGVGGFAAVNNFGVGSNPRSVAIGDFNGDGNQDLVTANQMPSGLSVLLGNGAGGFGAAMAFVAGANLEAVVVGDFNSDGKQDLATANFSSNVSVLLGNGAGSFSSATNFDAGENPSSVAVGDFNGDGLQDLAVANFGSDDVSVLLGNGAGSFSVAINFGSAADSNSVAVGDFNGDGQQDLATANSDSNNVSVLLRQCPAPTLGNYANTAVQLSANTTITPDATPVGTTSINVSTSTGFKGQLEGDPSTGVVRVTDAHPAGTYTVSVKALNGAGGSTTKTFSLVVTTPATCNPVSFTAGANLGVGTHPRSVAIGDFNRDGKQDVAIANVNSHSVSVLLGNGMGNFSSATNFGVGSLPELVAVGDFNGDGKQDLVTANLGSGNVSILLGDGAGGFGDATNFASGNLPESVAVGDFNGDGNQDLAVANSNSDQVSVLLGDGGGSFGGATFFDVGSLPQSVAVADFNNDGKQDLAVSNGGANDVSVLLGNGAGSFGAATNFGAGTTPSSVAVGDFNADGEQDLAVANIQSNNVSVLIGNGAGGFSAATNFGAGIQPLSVASADFNGDGKQDLVLANIQSNNVSVLLGNGAGSFSVAINFGVGTNPFSVAVGDFNGDGKQDLAITNFDSATVSVLLRQCPPSNIVPVTSTNDSGPGSLRQAILDANVNPGTDTIAFQIPGPGVHTFTLLSPLNITQPLIIDGYTQPGASANTLAVGNNATLLIEFNGNGGNFSGLNITGGSSTVRGLVINRFGDSGIRLSGNGGNAVEGCFIGTAPSGMAASSNGVGVAVVSSPSNTIGGETPAARNIISGNLTAGIQLGEVSKPAAMNNAIRGNYIGTNATGTGPLGNGLNNPAGGNGILVPANAIGATIQGNRIAYNAGNVQSNTGNGVRLLTPTGVGDAPGTQIEITENQIFGNTGLGIDLGPAGVTPNDPGDADLGPNFLQNFPTLTSFFPAQTSASVLAGKKPADPRDPEIIGGATVTIVGQLNSTPNTTFAVHWYFSPDTACPAMSAPTPNGKVSGVLTNCNGNAPFSFNVTLPPGVTSGIVTTSATDSMVPGNTSELSCFPVSSTPWQPVVLAPDQIDQINAWTIGGRTYVYVRLKFPDAGYRVVNWGTPGPTGTSFTVNASVERFSGPSIQSVVTTAQIYDLGPLLAGPYNFNFKTSGTLAKTGPFTVSSTVPPANPIDDARKFVKQQYLDFLNREADKDGEDFWTNNITKCSNPAERAPGQTFEQCTLRQRETTSGAFFLSPEFQYTGYFVYRMYQGALGRQPKLSEFTPDALFVGSGIIVGGELSGAKINENKAAFAAQFVNCTDTTKYRCAEFKAIYDGLCNQQYVDKLFETTGVNADATERAALVNGLSAATETRASVLQKVVDGINVMSEGNQQFTTLYGEAFYKSELNRAFVQLEYFGYLRRDPDEAGYLFWLNKLNGSGGDFVKAEMVLAFISSPEYRARFGEP